MDGSITTIARAIQAGETSALAVMTDTLDRIASYDAIQPQAWIERLSDEALKADAATIDRRIADGETLPLAGVPFAVKDNIDVAGLPTTAACPEYAYMPERSAAVVAKLQEAGAICVGKTNLDQFATGLVGTRSPYGAPRCVFNRDYISGGSSSGSAVVVAAGLVPFALGTDTAGSGRVPAAINGCVGFKPSKGRWSTSGLVPACRSLDCISVFTGNAEDAALIDSVVAGYDDGDPFSRSLADTAFSNAEVILGIPLPGQLEFYGDRESAALFEAAVDRYRSLGAQIEEIDITPLIEAAELLYGGPWVAERYAAVGDFIDRHPDAVDPTVGTIIRNGRLYSAADTFRGIYALRTLRRMADDIWAKVDALILPTTPTIYSVLEVLEQPFRRNSHMGYYTAAINLLDMCAVALPAGFRQNKTGFGISLIGPAFADASVLALGKNYCDTTQISHPPLDVTPPKETVLLAVVGAHLEGMPLNWQLTSRKARLVEKTATAPAYKLYCLANSVPPKPALIHIGDGGSKIEVEIYEMPVTEFGRFVTYVTPPLAIGTVTLENLTEVKGFVAEPRAVDNARDISEFGGWRKFIQESGR